MPLLSPGKRHGLSLRDALPAPHRQPQPDRLGPPRVLVHHSQEEVDLGQVLAVQTCAITAGVNGHHHHPRLPSQQQQVGTASPCYVLEERPHRVPTAMAKMAGTIDKKRGLLVSTSGDRPITTG